MSTRKNPPKQPGRGRPRSKDPKTSTHVPLSRSERDRLNAASTEVGKSFASWARESLLRLADDPGMTSYLPLTADERSALADQASREGLPYVIWARQKLLRAARLPY